MKIFNQLCSLFLAAAAVCSISACQSEDAAEDYILDGVCWGGRLPISEQHGQQNYTSNFYFLEENGYGLGFEEMYYRGTYDTTVEFSWYWFDHSYRMLCLNYGGTGHSASTSYINILNAKKGRIKGWFYQSLEDYEYDTNNGSSSSWRGTSVELKRVDDYDRGFLEQLLKEWRGGNPKSYIPYVQPRGH